MDPTASILFGKTRQAVLSTLFEQGEDGIYIRELERRTGISTGTLHHELRQLMQADLVEKASDGNRVVYRINESHPIHDELRAIVQKTCGLPVQVREALVPLKNHIRLAAIFGSIAKGTSHSDSDVDVLIVGDLSPAEVIDRIQPLERDLNREIGFRLYSVQEFSDRRNSDPFLDKVLAGPLITLMGSVDDA